MSIFKSSLVTLTIVLGMLGRPQAGAAQEGIDYFRALDIIEVQTIATQRMAKEALLVALGIDPQDNLDRLVASRVGFNRAMIGLRDGDAELGLPPAVEEIREDVDRALGLWGQMDEALNSAISAGQVSADEVALIAGVALPLLDAVEAVSEFYRDQAPGSEHFSMLVTALDTCARQRLLSQRMTKEFLLIAYGTDPELNRQRLTGSIEEFERAQDGLINGNLDMALLPAPTMQIKRTLLQVADLWEVEFRPLLNSAADGDRIAVDAVAEAARVNMLLIEEMGVAEAMYGQL